MKKYHTLLLLSGGLDSTTCLFKLLSQTQDEISTIYVDVTNNSSKSWCEQLAVDLLRKRAEKHFRKLGDHTNITTTIAGCANGGFSQPQIWMLHAAFKLSEVSIKSDLPLRLCVGYTRGDSAAEHYAFNHIKKLWCELWRVTNNNPVPELYAPLINSTKHNSRNFLRKLERDHKGLKIINTLWVCEKPINVVSSRFTGYKPCGKCNPCIRSKRLK